VRRLQVRKLLGANRIPVTLVRRSDGLRVRIGRDPLDEAIADSVTRRHRSMYFPPEFDELHPRLVVDIGAHHGFYSLAALFEYPGCEVIALEPSASAVEVLRRNVRRNGCSDRVHIEPVAVGHETGLVQLQLDRAGSWGHSLIGVEHDGGSEVVRQLTLRDVLGHRVPEVIKCNAEGGEVAVVQGLTDLAELPKGIVLMVHPDLIDAASLRSQLLSLGYRVRDAKDGSHPVWICVWSPERR
jgi:FkbM family methyltransferase